MREIARLTLKTYVYGMLGTWLAGMLLDTFDLLNHDYSNYSSNKSLLSGPIGIITAGFVWPYTLYNYKNYIKN